MKKILKLSLVLCFVLADEFFEPKTSIGGYGEMHWDMTEDSNTNLDFHRFILYFKHQFSPEWSMMSEVEIEHNMVGSEASLGYGDDNTYNKKYKGGYVAMEQAHLNYWNGNWGFQGGVLLIPSGIINEYHEPPTFMSVERPEYNKYVIPTTWFDNGFAFYGAMGDFNWKVAMTGDMDGDKIDDGIRSARRKGHYSRTDSWTKTIQGSWTGMEGLKVGGSITMNDAPTSEVEASDEETINTWEYDEISDQWINVATVIPAVEAVAAGTIGVNLTEFNATYSANNIYARMEYGMIDYTNGPTNNNNILLKSTSGYYLDLGYNIADLVGCDDSDLYLWTRMSSFNKNDDDIETENNISLFGVTYKPLNNVSFKFEMGTHEKWDSDTGAMKENDVMRMGIGYMF